MMSLRRWWGLPICVGFSATCPASGQEVPVPQATPAAAPSAPAAVPMMPVAQAAMASFGHWPHHGSYMVLVPTGPGMLGTSPVATTSPVAFPQAAPQFAPPVPFQAAVPAAQPVFIAIPFPSSSAQGMLATPTPQASFVQPASFRLQTPIQPQLPPPPFLPSSATSPTSSMSLEQLEQQARQQRQATIQTTQAMIERMEGNATLLRGQLAQLDAETTRARALLRELEATTPRETAPPAPIAPTATLSLPPRPDESRLDEPARATLARTLSVVNEHHATSGLKPEQRRAHLTALARQFYSQSIGPEGESLKPDESRDIANLIDLLMQPQSVQVPPAPPAPPAPPSPPPA